MAKPALALVALGIFYRMDLPHGFDLWLYGADAQEMLTCCQDSYAKFRAFSPSVKEKFLLQAERELAGRGKSRRTGATGVRPGLEVIGKTLLNLGAFTLIPATLYILQREGRLNFDGYNGCVMITRSNGQAAVRISAIARSRSPGFPER